MLEEQIYQYLKDTPGDRNQIRHIHNRFPVYKVHRIRQAIKRLRAQGKVCWEYKGGNRFVIPVDTPMPLPPRKPRAKQWRRGRHLLLGSRRSHVVEDYLTGEHSFSTLAAKYEVSASTISNILHVAHSRYVAMSALQRQIVHYLSTTTGDRRLSTLHSHFGWAKPDTVTKAVKRLLKDGVIARDDDGQWFVVMNDAA